MARRRRDSSSLGAALFWCRACELLSLQGGREQTSVSPGASYRHDAASRRDHQRAAVLPSRCFPKGGSPGAAVSLVTSHQLPLEAWPPEESVPWARCRGRGTCRVTEGCRLSRGVVRIAPIRTVVAARSNLCLSQGRELTGGSNSGRSGNSVSRMPAGDQGAASGWWRVKGEPSKSHSSSSRLPHEPATPPPTAAAALRAGHLTVSVRRR